MNSFADDEDETDDAVDAVDGQSIPDYLSVIDNSIVMVCHTSKSEITSVVSKKKIMASAVSEVVEGGSIAQACEKVNRHLFLFFYVSHLS
jgi:hypothetical protein